MARRRISRSAEAGHTLIELMVALTIVAAITAFAIPAARAVLPGVELRRTAEAVADAAKAARRAALTEAREGWVEIDVSARQYRAAGGSWRALPAGSELRLVTAAQERSGADRGRIRFYSTGAATGGSLTLSTEDRSYEISVDWLTGAVRLTEGPGA